MTTGNQIKRKPGRFRIGDKVRLIYFHGPAEGEILEDQGPLGVGGAAFTPSA
jgi:hypothetical protein